ncbi:MAG: phage integrase SAM-like domain-containing protein [Betaproteobacteria bacterium]|nr:phage integrase SAM-like domain-containing protein [Betaproteobacteria bacterium]
MSIESASLLDLPGLAADGKAAYEALYQRWEKSGERRATTLEAYWKILESFAGFVDWMPLGQIRRKYLLAFRDHLLDRGLSMTTVANRLGMLKSFFRVAVDYECLPENPAERIALPRRPRVKARVAFAAEDLNRLFRSPVYTEAFRPLGGGREAAYWLPLLALFTGARIEELAQLKVADIRHAPGLGHYFDIHDGDNGQLKNLASKRRIPLHHELLACGFLDYAKSARRPFLFPDLKLNPRGKRGGYFSNFFSGYLRRKIGITDRRKVFHSFRHTFKDTCRAVGIDEEVHDALTGHSRPGASRGYGNEHFPLAPLFEAIRQFSIEALEIGHLHRSAPEIPQLPASGNAISAYYGVDVSLCLKSDQPHIIARCQDDEAALCIADNRIARGRLPKGKLLLVQAWVEIHRQSLIVNWENARCTGKVFPIAPLH